MISSNSIPFFYKCKTCSRQGQTNDGKPACSKFNIIINPETDFCAWHDEKDGVTCQFCDKTDNLIVETINNNIYTFCQEHYTAFHQCQGCTHFNICPLSQDKSEPQVVTKTIRQGGMLIQTQVKNPNLMKKHCSNCCCFSNEVCVKDSSIGCPKWQPQITMLR